MSSEIVAGVIGAAAALLGVAVQDQLARRYARENRLWAERVAAYNEASVAAERMHIQASRMITGEDFAAATPNLPESAHVGAITGRLGIVAPRHVRASWGTLVAAHRILSAEVNEWWDDHGGHIDESTDPWPADTPSVVAVLDAARGFQETMRAAVGNRD